MKNNNAPYPSNNCFVEDVEGVQAAKAQADFFDYTGMSDGEIFISVFGRYAEQFGDRFLDYDWQQIVLYEEIYYAEKSLKAKHVGYKKINALNQTV